MQRRVVWQGAAGAMGALAALGALGRAAPVWAQATQAPAGDLTGGDPMESMQWPTLRKQYLGDAPMRFAPEVVVRGPVFADDAMNVPLLVNARALEKPGSGPAGQVDRIMVLVDRNPIREVLEFRPGRAFAALAFRIRMEQASPVRALVQTRDGMWHVGSTWVKASGGGCTVPGLTRADGSWSRTLNQVQTRIFPNTLEGSRRLRVRVMHPMDTGLVAGVPSFHIEQLRMVDELGDTWWSLVLHEPVSENPLLTFELPPHGGQGWRLIGRDNNGNTLDAEVTA